MKVQYLKKHTDESGKTYLPGWTAEHTQPHSERLIADGIAQRAPDHTRPTKSTQLITDCVPLAPLAGEIKPTGEEIDLDDEPAPKTRTAGRWGIQTNK